MNARIVLRNPTCRGALLGVACALVCWLLNGASWVRDLEHRSYDNGLGFRGPRRSAAPIVIVGLDEASLQKIPKPLRFLSPELAEVVGYLRDQGAAAIGVDLLFPESEETISELLPGGPGDLTTMGRAVARAGNVVLPMRLMPGEPSRLPVFEWLPPVRSHWTDLGFVNLTADSDRLLRAQQLRAADTAGAVHPSFALAVFAAAHRLPPQWFADPSLRLDGRPIPLDAQRRLRVNYVGPPGTIDAVPFVQVLDAARGKKPLDRDWRDALVLIGVTAAVQEDLHAVPRLNQSLGQVLRSSWLYHQSDLMPGVEIHANVMATLADRAFITTPWWLQTPLLLLVVGAALGAALARLSLEAGVLLVFLHHWAWQLVCLFAFRWADWQVEMIAMLGLGGLVFTASFALRWRWMRQMMGMVKSEAVARALEADPGKLDLRGEQRELSVLFADVRNFTSFSEAHSAPEVVRLLNEFFAAVVPIVEAHRGIVNQYLGDGMMVLFGAPQPQPDHALQAVRAALAIGRRIHELAGRWRQLGAEGFRVGIGIHTGKAVVGTVGSRRRLDYTAIGDTVNTAARIESGNKELGTEILISQATFEALPAGQREQLLPGAAPASLTVKGKREALCVYPVAVIPPAEAVRPGP